MITVQVQVPRRDVESTDLRQGLTAVEDFTFLS